MYRMNISEADIATLGQRLKHYPGKCDGFIRLLEERSETVIYLGEDVKLDPSLPLKREVDLILGPGASQFV